MKKPQMDMKMVIIDNNKRRGYIQENELMGRHEYTIQHKVPYSPISTIEFSCNPYEDHSKPDQYNEKKERGPKSKKSRKVRFGELINKYNENLLQGFANKLISSKLVEFRDRYGFNDYIYSTEPILKWNPSSSNSHDHNTYLDILNDIQDLYSVSASYQSSQKERLQASRNRPIKIEHADIGMDSPGNTEGHQRDILHVSDETTYCFHSPNTTQDNIENRENEEENERYNQRALLVEEALNTISKNDDIVFELTNKLQKLGIITVYSIVDHSRSNVYDIGILFNDGIKIKKQMFYE